MAGFNSIETIDIDDDQMSCVICGHIAPIGDPYQTEALEDDDFPICPECGGWNVGGYCTFAPWGAWNDTERETMQNWNLAQ